MCLQFSFKPLEPLLEPLDLSLRPDQRLPVCKEEVSSEQQERNSGLFQEEPHGPQVKDGENREMGSLVCTSNEMEKQADAEDCGALQPRSDDHIHLLKNVTMNPDEWEENRQLELEQIAKSCPNLRKRMSDFEELRPFKKAKTMKIKIVKKNKTKKIQRVKKNKIYKITLIPVKCTICGKSVHDMNSHMEIHTGTKYFRYRCRICAEGFQHKADYWPHMIKCMHCFHGTLYTGI